MTTIQARASIAATTSSASSTGLTFGRRRRRTPLEDAPGLAWLEVSSRDSVDIGRPLTLEGGPALTSRRVQARAFAGLVLDSVSGGVGR
jgi:hypothetical protein